MFQRISSQKVQDEHGAIVQVTGSHSVEYLEPYLKATVAVDFGLRASVYAASLRLVDRLEQPIFAPDGKHQQILESILAGISAMGVDPVLA